MKRVAFKVVRSTGKRVYLGLPEEFPQASWKLSFNAEPTGSAHMAERKEQTSISGDII